MHSFSFLKFFVTRFTSVLLEIGLVEESASCWHGSGYEQPRTLSFFWHNQALLECPASSFGFHFCAPLLLCTSKKRI
ncbi:hypothetical protein GOP47_0015842 [Adiantum capillus-veneris]|uniref:Secreted protein n=1 Tax=Adiantum capillus-veneris TaxID=13818 RepID=A0A9D4ULC2_ADICA|nr:hypothetical protein GOP47_0015842 [Adiantum capillus-veneris]